MTNSFVSGFWWNELLGSLKHSHSFGCRQSLVGGRYALLDLSRRQPAADFYSTLLWRMLMSPKALRITRLSSRLRHNATPAAEHNTTAKPPAGATVANQLRAFAHCARSTDGWLNQRGGVTVLLLNPTRDMSFDVEVLLPAEETERCAVVISAGQLSCT